MIRLKPDREKSLLHRHPWVFAGAIDQIVGTPALGDTVRVISSKGEFLAWGAYSPHSQIRIRIWSWTEDEEIGEVFFRERIEQAIAWRRYAIPADQTNAVRLIYAESDGLPGLIVDQYDETLVMQCLSCGAELWRELLADILLEGKTVQTIFERSDAEVRSLEGLPARVGLIRGQEPPALVEIFEHHRYLVDVRAGHKTGFYLDQRDNRAAVHKWALAREALDCFSYTGGFAINAISGGAKRVLAIDSSEDALSLGRKNVELNNLDNDILETSKGDVFTSLRYLRDKGRGFDLIILDPPKFAPTAKQAEGAARAYKDINLLALKLLRSEGLLFTFSCSGGIDAALFQKIVFGAALDANVETQIVGRLGQAVDHPVRVNFPEGSYLKGLVIRKI
jgi:23S rRNA (cytosine1962-C5)-methyltransferase